MRREAIWGAVVMVVSFGLMIACIYVYG